MKNQGEIAAGILGADFVEKLQKNSDIALLKPASGLHIKAEEIALALNIVPRSVLAFLAANLRSMRVGESKTIGLESLVGVQAAGPITPEGTQPSPHKLRVTKLDNDMYNGEIEGSGKVLTTFKGKPLPGVGLVIMSTYEMYDSHAVEPIKEQEPKEAAAVQHMINQDMAHRAGILAQMNLEEILKLRIQTEMALKSLRDEMAAMRQEQHNTNFAQPEVKDEPKMTEGDLKLRRFLENREIKKREPNTFNVVMLKGETCACPDCRQNVFEDGAFKGCICLGDDRNRKIFMKKSENGMQIKFAKGWDPENIEMLLEILKRRKK